MVPDRFNSLIFWTAPSEQKGVLWCSCRLRPFYDSVRYLPGIIAIFSEKPVIDSQVHVFLNTVSYYNWIIYNHR